MFFVQYRVNITQICASRSKKLYDIQIIFTTRKLGKCLPTMKSSFDKILESHVVYKNHKNGCNSIYVDRTSRHVTTRILEHQKKEYLVGQHIVECSGTAHNIEGYNPDTSKGVDKLMKTEAINIKKLKPQLNTHDGCREFGIEVLVQKQKI